MSGAITPLPQHAFMAWCLIKAQGQLYLILSTESSVHDQKLKFQKAGGVPLAVSPGISMLCHLS
jgi:hypothetical protein